MTARELEERHALEVYPRRGISIVRGEDARLWDDQGNEYLDCAAGVGVAIAGHANPAVAAALGDPPSLPGRWERRGPHLLLDGAHTRESVVFSYVTFRSLLVNT